MGGDRLQGQSLLMPLNPTNRSCLFLVDHITNCLHGLVGPCKRVDIPLVSCILGDVASKGVTIKAARACDHPSYNPDIDGAIAGYKDESILCVPMSVQNTVHGVMVFLNKPGSKPLNSDDEDTFTVYSSFAGNALRNCLVHTRLGEEKRKNELLVHVLGNLSQADLMKGDEVVETITTGAQELLGAERCAFFCVDKERNELYSQVALKTGNRQIRFRMNQGIAGEVARTQTPLNIQHPYSDPRFNEEVDKQFEFTTKNILCFPVIQKGETVGVMQLINKIDDLEGAGFTKVDLEILEYFAMFAGIALANCRMLEFALASSKSAVKCMQNVQGWQSGDDDGVLGSQETDYKLKLSRPLDMDEVQRLMAVQLTDEDLQIVRSIQFNIHDYKAPDRCDKVIPLLVSLIEHLGCFELGIDRGILFRFFVRVRTLYRIVPYHNWFHAADVVQTMFLFIDSLRETSVFTPLDKYVLLIAASLHDVDHMGVNNSFHLKTDTPMGILTSCTGSMSVLEIHHCNIAMEVLKDADTNAFHCLTDKTPYALRSMVNIILATDMARHGDISKKFKELPTLVSSHTTSCPSLTVPSAIGSVTYACTHRPCINWPHTFTDS